MANSWHLNSVSVRKLISSFYPIIVLRIAKTVLDNCDFCAGHFKSHYFLQNRNNFHSTFQFPIQIVSSQITAKCQYWEHQGQYNTYFTRLVTRHDNSWRHYGHASGTKSRKKRNQFWGYTKAEIFQTLVWPIWYHGNWGTIQDPKLRIRNPKAQFSCLLVTKTILGFWAARGPHAVNPSLPLSLDIRFLEIEFHV